MDWWAFVTGMVAMAALEVFALAIAAIVGAWRQHTRGRHRVWYSAPSRPDHPQQG